MDEEEVAREFSVRATFASALALLIGWAINGLDGIISASLLLALVFFAMAVMEGEC